MVRRFLVTEEGRIGKEITEGTVDAGTVSCASFAFDEEQAEAALLGWPRNTRYARVPEQVDGCRITAVSPLAFAAYQFPEDVWNAFSSESALSFSVFSMIHAGKMIRNSEDQGGPEEVELPDTVRELGRYAFWHCDRLKKVRLSKNIAFLQEGTFGECSRLEEVTLPEALERIGSRVRAAQGMPDLGVFAGCHALRALILPEHVEYIGAHTFNSCGIETLTVLDEQNPENPGSWSRNIEVHSTAFDHTASLQWMRRMTGGETVWEIGLARARDKILNADAAFGALVNLPRTFFAMTPAEADELARRCFRLDFAGRMAIARLRHPKYLTSDMSRWYRNILITYFDRLDEFWPAKDNQQEEAFALIRQCSDFDAEELGELMYIAGRSHAKTELMYEMMEYRNSVFAGITGLESLAL